MHKVKGYKPDWALIDDVSKIYMSPTNKIIASKEILSAMIETEVRNDDDIPKDIHTHKGKNMEEEYLMGKIKKLKNDKDLLRENKHKESSNKNISRQKLIRITEEKLASVREKNRSLEQAIDTLKETNFDLSNMVKGKNREIRKLQRKVTFMYDAYRDKKDAMKHNTPTLLPKEQVDFIKNLSNEMKTQDNRGTAQPYALVIRTKTITPTDARFSDNLMIHWDEIDYYTFEEFIQAFHEYCTEDDEYHPALEFIREHDVDDMDTLAFAVDQINPLIYDEIMVYAYVETMTADSSARIYDGNFFLTETACRRHMEANKHHFNDPDTYGIHLYRNPEMDKLYEFIHAIAKVL